jgi:dolichol-phosphate mannosyltransferase
MSKTFLFDSAITAALDFATADAVVIMCSDLQDPPSIIPDLISGYEQGFDQVVVKIKSRKGTPFLIRVFANLFYKIAYYLTQGDIPKNVSDYRLASRACYQAARSLRESNRFIRGQFAWVGFKKIEIEIDRPRRLHGKSKFLQFPRWRAIWLALNSIFSFSSVPLAIIAAVGGLSSLFSLILTFFLAILWLFFGVPFAGYGTIVASIILGFSLVFLILGIQSMYISSIYEEVKRRPLYIINERTDQ